MKELIRNYRLLLCETLLQLAVRWMPEGREKLLLQESLIQWATIIEHELRKQIKHGSR